MRALTVLHTSGDRRPYLLVFLVSVLLSLWSAYAQFIPNPDAMLYLRAAEYFSVGRWAEAVEVYRWPFYSLVIALAMKLTGAEALLAAQSVNLLLDGATAVVFVAIVRRLAGHERLGIVFWAALFILLNPKLMQLRPVIIRDHGFIALFLTVIYLVVVDQQARSLWIKGGICVAIALASLFRLEAAFLLLLVPAFYIYVRSSKTAARVLILAVLVACLMLIPGFSLWRALEAYSKGMPGGYWGTWLAQMQLLFRDVQATGLQLERILPAGRNVGGLAIAGIILAITLDALLRALTIPIAVLSALAYWPRLVMPELAGKVVAWFAGWQIPLLLTFAVFSLFVDWRYAMAFSLMASIPAVFTLDAVAQDFATCFRAKVLLAMAVATVLVPSALAFPRYSKFGYLRDAGVWIRDQVPPAAKIVTNDGRIAYYSDRRYDHDITVRPTALLGQSLTGADYVFVHVERVGQAIGSNMEHARLVGTFSGSSGGQVLAYRLR